MRNLQSLHPAQLNDRNRDHSHLIVQKCRDGTYFIFLTEVPKLATKLLNKVNWHSEQNSHIWMGLPLYHTFSDYKNGKE